MATRFTTPYEFKEFQNKPVSEEIFLGRAYFHCVKGEVVSKPYTNFPDIDFEKGNLKVGVKSIAVQRYIADYVYNIFADCWVTCIPANREDSTDHSFWLLLVTVKKRKDKLYTDVLFPMVRTLDDEFIMPCQESAYDGIGSRFFEFEWQVEEMVREAELLTKGHIVPNGVSLVGKPLPTNREKLFCNPPYSVVGYSSYRSGDWELKLKADNDGIIRSVSLLSYSNKIRYKYELTINDPFEAHRALLYLADNLYGEEEWANILAMPAIDTSLPFDDDEKRHPDYFMIVVPLFDNEYDANDVDELFEIIKKIFKGFILRHVILKREKEVRVFIPKFVSDENEMQSIFCDRQHKLYQTAPYDIIRAVAALVKSRGGWIEQINGVSNVPKNIIYFLESEWDYISNKYVYDNLDELERFFNTLPDGKNSDGRPLYKIRYVTRAEIETGLTFFNTIDVDKQPDVKFVVNQDTEKKFNEGYNIKTVDPYVKISFMNTYINDTNDKDHQSFIGFEFEGKMGEDERNGRIKAFKSLLYGLNHY